MFILIDLSLYIFYFIVFLLTYFYYEKLSNWSAIAKIKRPKILDDFIQGTFLGAMTVIFSIINKAIEESFALPLFVSTVILLAFFKNYLSGLFALTPGLVYQLFFTNLGNEIYFILGGMFFYLLIVVYIKNLVKNSWITFSIFCISLFVSVSLFLFGLFYFTNKSSYFLIRNLSMPFMFTFFIYLLMNWFIKVSISSKILHESSQFTILKYYRNSVYVQKLNDFIVNNKIKYGFLIVFNLNYKMDDEPISLSEINLHLFGEIDLEKVFLEEIQNALSKNSVLFSLQENKKGIFIPINKLNDSKINKIDLEKLNNIFNASNKKYYSSNNKNFIHAEINMGVSIYGIDNQSINKLINYSNFALKNKMWNEHIAFFKAKDYINSIQLSLKFNQMNKFINLDNFSNLYTPLFDLNNFSFFACRVHVENSSDYSYKEKINDLIYFRGWDKLFNKFYAANAILNSNNNRIIFDYSPLILENDFNHKSFISFLKRHNVNSKNIFILFRIEGLQKIKNHSKVKSQIKILKKYGLNFVFPNNTSKKIIQKIIKYPEYVFEDAKKLNNFELQYKLSKLMIFNIELEEEVKLSKKIGAKYLGGKLFKEKLFFTKFDKQSKIYIENILERK